MERKNQGITLIALIITIIIMLILAGIVLTLTIGENGIIRKAQIAGANYVDAQEYERNELAKVEDYIQNGRENSSVNSNLEGSEIKLLTTISAAKNAGGNGTYYDMETFTRNETEDINTYLEYDTTNNYYKIKKSGWYIIDMTLLNRSSSSAQSNLLLNFYVNGINKSKVRTYSRDNAFDDNSKSITLYLTKDSTIYFTEYVYGTLHDEDHLCEANVFVMD